jgi:hypothetical protein
MANKLTNYFKPKSKDEVDKHQASSLFVKIINEVRLSDSDSTDSNDKIWKNITSLNKSNIIDNDVVCIDDDEDMISSAQDSSKQVINDDFRYTQEDVSTLGLDEDRDIIILSGDDQSDNQSDDDNDLIIFMEKINKSMPDEVKTEKIDLNEISERDSKKPAKGESDKEDFKKNNNENESEDEDLISFLKNQKSIEENTKNKDNNSVENESNAKLKTYSSTRPVRPNDQKFDFAWNWDDDDDDDEEKEEPIFDKSSKGRKRIRSDSSSGEEKEIKNKTNQDTIAKEKYEKFIEKTKSNYHNSPRTMLINEPKRLKIASVESVNSKPPHSTATFSARKTLSKIGEKLKKDKSYEARAFINKSISKFKKPSNISISPTTKLTSLTQGIQLAKQEKASRTIRF